MAKFILRIVGFALNIGVGGAVDHYFSITQFIINVTEKTLSIFDMNDIWARWIIIVWLGLIIKFISDKIGFSKWIYNCGCMLLKKMQKEKTETINEHNINFSNITPYCEIKHAVPSIGVRIEIINSSTEIIYCSVNSEVTFLKINDRANKQKLISFNIKVHPYSHPKSFNCLKNQIQDIEVYQKPFKLEFHIQLDFYKKPHSILFSKNLHYEADCIFIQDAIERNRLHLEIMSIKCNEIPEIEFTKLSKS